MQGEAHTEWLHRRNLLHSRTHFHPAHASLPLTHAQSLGYAYVLLSAIFFAMSTVRMGRYSTQFSSLSLASASTFSLAALSLGWVFASVQGEWRLVWE